MHKILPLAQQLSRARWLPLLVIALTLAVLGSTIFQGSRRLRLSIRDQIVNRDAEVLDAVTVLEQLGADSPANLAESLGDTASQMTLVLRLSSLREGVLAVRLFSPQGDLTAAMPTSVRATRLDSRQLLHLRRLQPLSQFESMAHLEDYFLVPPLRETPNAPLPLLSVLIPLHAEGQTNLLAVAELIQEGSAIARELARLDRNLTRQAWSAFAVGGGIVLVSLGWAFYRLQRLTGQLQDHAANLRRANQELALSAKTSALGAVTAHVLHGLTSPLTGLRNFATAHATEDEEWQAVLTDTQRMQNLVGEMVRVLGEQTDGTHYELPVPELVEVLASRIRAAAQNGGVHFQAEAFSEGVFSNRTANLVLLILENLVRNAIQATPTGKHVRVSIRQEASNWICEVADEGPGFPQALRESLFVPCRSTKPAGNGLGLALSQQLARHLGAELSLVCSGPDGSVIRLTLPRSSLESEPGCTCKVADDLGGCVRP